MADTTQPETNSSTSPPVRDSATGSKQNLLISLAVGAVVLLIFLMAYLYLQANRVETALTGDSGSDFASLPVATEDSSDLHKRATALASRLGADATALASMVVDLNTRLTTAEEELKGTRALYASAARRVGQLEEDAGEAGRNAAEVELLRVQLAEMRSILDISKRRSDALASKLASAPDPSSLAEAEARSDSYLVQLREKQARLDLLEPENALLKAELSATETELDSVELFVERIERLPDAAKQLYMELARLETVGRSELQKNYDLITRDLGCRVIDRVTFATGSSEIAPAKAAALRTSIATAAPNSFFLVVGYASKTGNFDINKSLSSDRARSTAELIDVNKNPTQDVRGVFLGQTDRFSTSNVYDDQVCEIWEIPR